MTGKLAYTHDSTVYRGAEKELQMELTDQAGDPYDLSGTTVTLRMAHSYTDKYAVLEVLGSIVDAAAGTVKFNFTTQMTEALSVKAYDLQVRVDDYPAYLGRIGVKPLVPEVEA